MIELSEDPLVEKIDIGNLRFSRDDICKILKKNECKPRVEHSKNLDHEVDKDEKSKSEEIGMLIDRETLKPATNLG